MNGGANAPKLEQRPSSAVALLRRMERRVGFCEFRFDTPQDRVGEAKDEVHLVRYSKDERDQSISRKRVL